MLIRRISRHNNIINRQMYHFIELPSKQQIEQKKRLLQQRIQNTKIPTLNDMKETMEDNIRRLKMVYQDVRTFIQIRPKIKQFNKQLKSQDVNSFIDLGEHQKYYFLQKDLLKFVPIYIIILLPMTCFILPYYIYRFPHFIPSKFQYEALINEFHDKQKREYLDSKQQIIEQCYKFNGNRTDDLQLQDFLHLVRFFQLDIKLNYSDVFIGMVLQMKGQQKDQNHIDQYKQQLILKQFKYELDLMSQQDYLVQRYQHQISTSVMDQWLTKRGFEQHKHSRDQYIYQISCSSDDVNSQVRKYIQAYLQ